MQIPILNGIYTDDSAEFRTSYPRNMVPVPKPQGISNGYLRPADGIVSYGTGPGVDRGGIVWNGALYRVMGTKLVSVNRDGSVNILGDVGGGDLNVSLDYSFDRLAIASGGNLFYYDGALTQVTDSDLGKVQDVMWVDGYFMTTDGVSLVVTDLADPFSVNPFKYGSAESDPDPIMRLLKVKDEPFIIGRYTIEVQSNIGGNFYPFQRIPGAIINRGAIGRKAATVFMDMVAFVGGRRNEPPAVWMAINGQSDKVSTREVDQILQEYTEGELQQYCVVETRVDKSHEFLYIHLPDQTLVFDYAASQVAKEPVWFTLDSGRLTKSRYRARNITWCYDQWVVGDPTSNSLGVFTDKVSSHYGDTIGWEFGTMIMYNDGHGLIINELELVTLSGRVDAAADPTIWTSYSVDGMKWSQERPKKAGKLGQVGVRLAWLQQGSMRNWRIQKFRGDSDAFLTVARLETQVEALYV